MSDRKFARSGEPHLTAIFWRDIPTQVKAKSGPKNAGAKLPGRLMVSVDAAPTKAGMTSTDDYVGEWRRYTRACGEDIQEEVTQEATRINHQS